MSKMRRRRLFGMTLSQMMILGCLALGAVGAIFGSFIFISSSTTPGGIALFPSPAPTFPPQATNMDGQPPVVQGPAAIPSFAGDDQTPSNWTRYASTTIEIAVPPQFEEMNAELERQKWIESYRGQGYGQLADRLEAPSFDYRLWFNFPQSETAIYRTHIIIKADVLPTFTLNEYVDEAYGAGLQGFQVIDRQETTVGTLQAQRVLLTTTLNDFSVGIAEYVITDEVNLWVISASSNIEEFYGWLPEFDRVTRSFRLLY
jgi:hypothetical protein